jgi:Domain of unknown function (DUF1771)
VSLPKKGEILHKLRMLSATHADCVAQAKAMKSRHQQLSQEYLPRIRELQREADILAEQFKSLYREASTSFSEGDGALAKSLSTEGHAAQERCEALNAEANQLRHELGDTLNKHQVNTQRADTLQNEIARFRKELTTARRTRVLGFEHSDVLDNIVIERVLDSFPQRIFASIARVEHAPELYAQTLGRGIRVPARGETTWDENGIAVVRVAPQVGKSLEARITRYSRALGHELGHVVYENFLTDHQKAEWYATDYDSSNFFSAVSLQTEVEAFAEAFALITLEPRSVDVVGQMRHRFMKTVIAALEQ